MQEEKEKGYLTQPFLSWLRNEKGERLNTLTQADILSDTLFKTPYNALFTYQKNYIIKQLAKAEN